MNGLEEIALLKKEVKDLKTEVAGLRDFIANMYSMMSDGDEDGDDFPFEMYGNPGMGRFNT